jgi:hypothetical protein
MSDVSNIAVITPVFMYNYNKYALDAYCKFRENMYRQGMDLFTVEGKLPSGRWRLQNSNYEKKIYRIELQQPLWYKEALINWAVSQLPSHYDKIAWIDSDILLPDEWGRKACDKLDEGNVRLIQLSGKLQYLRENSTKTDDNPPRDGVGKSLVGYRKGKIKRMEHALDAKFFPGLGWAARREFFTQGGGVYDLDLVGAGDQMLIFSATGSILPLKNEMYLLKSCSNQSKIQSLVEHSKKCFKYVQGNIGFLKGTAYHIWHGDRGTRQYSSRHNLVKNLDWKKDVGRDSNGLPVILSSRYDVIEGLSKYFQVKDSV